MEIILIRGFWSLFSRKVTVDNALNVLTSSFTLDPYFFTSAVLVFHGPLSICCASPLSTLLLHSSIFGVLCLLFVLHLNWLNAIKDDNQKGCQLIIQRQLCNSLLVKNILTINQYLTYNQLGILYYNPKVLIRNLKALINNI